MGLENVKLTSKDRFKLKHFIKELKKHSGRGTELVTVYVPAGYELAKIIQHLQAEQGTASNIKSSSTRNNVTNALERMIQHLRLFKATPPNGLAAFSGNISEREGQPDIQVYSMEPPIPMKLRLYRCEKNFIIEPLEELVADENVFGMIVVDKREGDVALLKGKTIVPMSHSTSNVPGKHKSGGQCLLPDTLVQMTSGELRRIEHVLPGETVLAVNKQGNIQPSLVLDSWETRKPSTYRIRTRNPSFIIECSADHLLLQRTEMGLQYSTAEQLAVGEWLVFPETLTTNPAVERFPKTTVRSYELKADALASVVQARKKHALSQNDIAKAANLSQTTISAFERGVLKLPWNTLVSTLKAYKCKIEDVVEDSQVELSLPYAITNETAQLAGYFLGDGYRDETRIGLCEQREDVAETYAQLLKTVFGGTPHTRFREGKGYYETRIALGEVGKGFFAVLSELKTKESVPAAVMCAGDEAVAAFLKGLFDAEGSVTNDKIVIAMANKPVMQTVQLLLQRYGIIGSFFEKNTHRNPYKTKQQFTVQITDRESLARYAQLIGFTAVDKTNKLDKLLQTKSHTSKVRQIIASGSEVRRIVEKNGFNREIFPAVNNFFRNERGISKEAFARSVVAQAQGQLRCELEEIAQENILPVQIASIDVVQGEVRMIDISVQAENFIANGLIVHNSAARFERLRDGAAKDFYRRVADHAQEAFFPIREHLKGILLGGPGMSKEEFLEQGELTQDLKDRIIAIKDLSYTGDFGLQELLDKCEDVLAAEEVVEEKKAMQRFFLELSKNTGMAAYGRDSVLTCIQMGAVDTLLLSEALSDEDIEYFSAEADKLKTKIILVSLVTREGAQLKEMGKFAAILRYPVEA